MYVGVILILATIYPVKLGIPHVCGGDPSKPIQTLRCSLVFPMYVGVILMALTKEKTVNRIPHVCGGDPLALVQQWRVLRYSPCMWG